MEKTKEMYLRYKGPNSFSGFVHGQEYTLPVGQQDDGQLYVVHPADGLPWVVMSAGEFWQVWEKA